jgi:Protein of unknown function (DUF3054)
VRRGATAPLLDLACIVAFILVGANNHRIDEGVSWFLTVLWPIALAWFGVALAARLYARADGWGWRLSVTIAGGTALMAVLRGAFTERPWVSVFTLIYAVWMTVTTFGWRGVARRSARTTPATSSGPR